MFFHLGAEEFCERLDRVGKSRRPPQLKVVFKYLDAVLLVVVVDDVDLQRGDRLRDDLVNKLPVAL